MRIKTWKKVIAMFILCIALATQSLSVQAAQTIPTTTVAESQTTDSTVTELSTAKSKKKKSYTKKDLRLMSAIIFCEAGSESYAGKKAVGIVVMNRVRSKLYPNTVKGVIYQKYQFSPVRNGAMSRALKAYDDGKFTTKNHKECIKAAKAVLKGDTKVTYKGKKIQMKSYLFFSGYVKNHRLKIGNHMFK